MPGQIACEIHCRAGTYFVRVSATDGAGNATVVTGLVVLALALTIKVSSLSVG